MSNAVRHIPYKNKLAKLIQAPGGKRIAAALADAQANLDQIADLCLAELDKSIAAIHRASAAPDKTPESFDTVYAAANDMTGLAGLFGRKDLGKAAHSLCELLDRSAGWEGCSPVALKVHVDSLTLLRHPDVLSAEQLADILDGLERVVERTTRAA
jgi:hypothetical protein